jgi:hypothetical protein
MVSRTMAVSHPKSPLSDALTIKITTISEDGMQSRRFQE